MQIEYKIGTKYVYPNSKEKFTLKKVKGCIFYFNGGKWCTDCVFDDLINTKTGLANWQIPKQLKLF